MKSLKYQFEYFCSPIWIKENTNTIYENINLEDFPFNDKLKNEIEKLDKVYQSTYNDDYPPEPIKIDIEKDILFTESVIKFYKKLKIELSNEYEILFNEQYWFDRLSELKRKQSNL